MRRQIKSNDRGESDRPLEFVFFKMGGTDYPAEDDSPTVYPAVRAGQVTFPKTVGAANVTVNMLAVEDFVYYAGDYIEDQSLVGCVGWFGQWHVVSVIPPEKVTTE